MSRGTSLGQAAQILQHALVELPLAHVLHLQALLQQLQNPSTEPCLPQHITLSIPPPAAATLPLPRTRC